MTKAALRGATCMSVAALSIVASMAQAQETATAAASPASAVEPAEKGEAILVTGSRIRRDNYRSPEPLTIITRDSMTEQGFNSLSDALQSNAVTAGSSQINNYYGGYVVDGGTGVNTVGLRGLGATRTLVLLNGHRLAPAGTRGSVGAVDLNTIPTAIVKSVEVLKAGASSIYGSDAVAGVINIITEDDLVGPKLDMQVNVPEAGAGVDRRISGAWGFKGDNWNVVASVDYRKRDSFTVADTNFATCPISGYLSGEGTALGSGDNIDPATGLPQCYTIDNGGVTINTLGVAAGHGGTRLRPNSAVTGGLTPGYEPVGYYTRDSFDPDMLKEQVVTPVETVNAFLQGKYQTGILGNAELYGEFLYSHRKSSQSGYRQLILDYAQGSPLVPALFRNDRFSAASEVSNGLPVAVRSFIGYGLLDSVQKVDFYRANGGLRGDLGLGDWRYDAYGSYSWSNSSYAQNTFLTSRVAQSLNVVQNGDGSFSCIDPSNGCVAAPEVNAASIGGNLSQAYRDFITANVIGKTKTAEYIGSFNVDGSLFQLPGGAAKAALGFEYRHSHLNDKPPIESIEGDLYNLTSAAPTRGSDEVWEVFGEMYLPVLGDMPGIYNLSFDGSGRYTHYRSYGGEWTYKGSVEYSPVRGATLRASYGTSYRAPALFEQFLGATSGFQSSSFDPCDDYANSANPTVATNCAAIGLPANFTQTSGVTVLSGGGAAQNLKAETSKNFSGGLIIQPVLPQSVGDLSVSLDYFSITINDGISQLGARSILNSCYGDVAFNPNSGFCSLVSRDANNVLTVTNNYLNISTQKAKGLEFNIRYSRDIGPGNFTFEALVTKFTDQSNQLFSNEKLVDSNGTIATPDWTGTFNATYQLKRVKFRYGLEWTGKTGDKTYEYLATDGETGTFDPADVQFLKDNYKFNTPDYFLHSASIQFDVADKFELTLGMRNIFDKKPPRITSDGLYYNTIGNAPLYSGYDYFGRTFYANVTTKF